MTRIGLRTTTAAMGAALMLVTGCSSESDGTKLQTIDPATAVVSPATTSSLDGVVHPYSGRIDSITFDPVTRNVLLVSQDPPAVRIVAADEVESAGPAAAGRDISIDGNIRDVSIASDGNALLSMDNQVVKLNLTSGEQTSFASPTRPTPLSSCPTAASRSEPSEAQFTLSIRVLISHKLFQALHRSTNLPSPATT